ncbi:16S rRNA (cytidine(1402)-2'-O)-methyltransferase [Candidatus Chlorohelix sp.]|uniref:16S rRNA (cytidine(1402)-2'-O)-methyltransferase n=1 Tax=Candidatus Chlorohelix sp. TaxID=3139201 RepID=UPI00303D6E1F
MPPGTLYVVSTPIGNLEDITLRALRLLREVALIAAEDTRHTRHLLNHFQIPTPAIAYHEHNKLTRLDSVLEKLNEGKDVALVSDAGTPCLSDPGWELVCACLERNIPVDAAPGVAAPLVSLVLSGFSPREFTYAGFPPRQKRELREWLVHFKPELQQRPLICFEAPHRLLALLETALEVWGECSVAACRELTKLHQEVRREKLSLTIAHFRETAPRGEFTLVFAEPEIAPIPIQAISEEEILEKLRSLKATGFRAKAAVEQISQELGLSHRKVYDLWLKL